MEYTTRIILAISIFILFFQKQKGIMIFLGVNNRIEKFLGGKNVVGQQRILENL